MTKTNTSGDYDLYSITTPVSLGQTIESFFDIVAGDDADEFKSSGNLNDC